MRTHTPAPRSCRAREADGDGVSWDLTRRAAAALFVVAAVAAAVPAAAAVSIAKVTDNATPVAGGAEFTYTITVTNDDAANPATDVVMTDPLPPSVLFQSVSLSGGAAGSWSCSGPAVGTNGVVECTAASVPASGSAVVTIAVQIAANVASGVRTNTARVASGGIEATASAGINIQVDAPLTVTKAGPGTVIAGDHAIYLITVNNGGATTALNVTVSDPLPAGVSFVSVLGTGGFFGACWFVPASATLTCFAEELASGPHHITLLVETAADLAAGPLVNTATITNPGTGTIVEGQAPVTTQVHVNEPPVAVDDAYLVNQVGPLAVTTLGVKDNDSDDEDDRSVLDAALVTGPVSGTLTAPLGADGSFSYTPDPGFEGTDSFTYTVTDSRGAVSNVATVYVTVRWQPVPLGPWTTGALMLLLAALGAWVLRSR